MSEAVSESKVVDMLASGLAFPEGPVFLPDGSLWFVELQGECLSRYQDGQVDRFPVGGEPNGAVYDIEGQIWFCDAGRGEIRKFDPASTTTETIADSVDGEPLFRPNDLVFDSCGNLLFTCPGDSRQNPTGYICVRLPDGSVHKLATGFYFPNGLAWNEATGTLVVAETRRQRLWKGLWDPQQAVWTDAKPWVSVGGDIGPDGMAYDADGFLYVAIYSGGVVKKITPDGRIAEEIALPGRNPTNCAFDPSGNLGLVVTEAETGSLFSLPGISFHSH